MQRRKIILFATTQIYWICAALGIALFCNAGFASNTESSTNLDWLMYRGSQQQLGVCANPIPDKLNLAWKFKTDGPIVDSAVIVGGTVVIGSGDGKIYALDIRNGEKIWSFETGSPVEASPMILNDSIYAGSTDGFIYSLDLKNGAMNWKFETIDKIVGSANWAKIASEENPLILAGSYDGSLYALDAVSGKERWRYESGSYINGSPAVYGDWAIVGGCDACIHCISLTDGKPVFVFDAGAYIAASIAIDGQRAYVGHYGNRFICFDVLKREIVWEYKDRDFPYFSSAAISGNFVVFGCRDKRVHCVERTTGGRIWVFPTKGQVDSSPVICGNDVFVGSEDGRLYRLRLSTGEMIGSYEIGSVITASPAIASHKMIIGADDGFVYAFGQ